MDRRLLWTTPIVIAGPAIAGHAATYLTVEQAQQLIFPGAELIPADVTLDDAQVKAIQKKSGVRVRHREQKVWKAPGLGWLIVDDVLGKHEFITYALGLNADGSVKQIEIMDYRETYGYEIRNADWRAQFVGKTSESKLALDDGIANISGATLSCRHITDGVKRLLAFHDVALR
jgi:Na+-translocating ferredoxin:NAD+ oxidoreductase RnfG subunit